MHFRLQSFVNTLDEALSDVTAESALLERVGAALHRLVQHDDWLEPSHRVPHPEHYQQYLLHCDTLGRYSVVSFVWGPGQCTPIHDHTVWGAIGMLRGAEVGTRYRLAGGRAVQAGPATTLHTGDVEFVSPTLGDIHRVQNASNDDVAISIHCYGADIGQVSRHVYYEDGRPPRGFISGYAVPHGGGAS